VTFYGRGRLYRRLSLIFVDTEILVRPRGEVMTKGWILLILFFSAILPVQVRSADQRYSVPLEDSPYLGPENATVTIVEFLDFQ
jgi:hypothetical protein